MKRDIQPYKNSQNSDNQDFAQEEAYIRAKKKLEKLVGFYWHLGVYIVINLFLMGVITYHSPEDPFFSFGKFATAFFWGIGLFFHFIGVFGPDFMFNKKWEERKIKEYMEKDKRNWE